MTGEREERERERLTWYEEVSLEQLTSSESGAEGGD